MSLLPHPGTGAPGVATSGPPPRQAAARRHPSDYDFRWWCVWRGGRREQAPAGSWRAGGKSGDALTALAQYGDLMKMSRGSRPLIGHGVVVTLSTAWVRLSTVAFDRRLSMPSRPRVVSCQRMTMAMRLLERRAARSLQTRFHRSLYRARSRPPARAARVPGGRAQQPSRARAAATLGHPVQAAPISIARSSRVRRNRFIQ